MNNNEEKDKLVETDQEMMIDGRISRQGLYFFIRFYFTFFRQRGREGEREGEKHQCVVASQVPPTQRLGPQPRHVP